MQVQRPEGEALLPLDLHYKGGRVKVELALAKGKAEHDKRDSEKKKDWGRVTVQADKEIDFLTIKKVLYTATEAGATLINFAVAQKAKDEVPQ